jgi:PAT family beta-lactamase induction signal transducer AmpG
MASSGVETGAIASVVGAAALPWTIKLVNGFLIDRYTLLAMGRRRIWIIGAQTMLVVSLIVGALIAPLPSDVATIAAIAFAANAAVTFQDVGIDNLAIDIMPEEERARAGGIMAGAQFVGVSLTTASGGWLLAQFGIAVCLLVLAVIPGLVMLFAVVIRERTGEKRLPWSAGRSHPRNEALQVEAWWPLLRSAPRAILAPVSLLLLPILLIRSIP